MRLGSSGRHVKGADVLANSAVVRAVKSAQLKGSRAWSTVGRAVSSQKRRRESHMLGQALRRCSLRQTAKHDVGRRVTRQRCPVPACGCQLLVQPRRLPNGAAHPSAPELHRPDRHGAAVENPGSLHTCSVGKGTREFIVAGPKCLSPHTKSPRSPFPHPALRSGPLPLAECCCPPHETLAYYYCSPPLRPSVRPSHCLAASPLVVAPTMSASPASNTDTGELLAPLPPPPKPTQQNPAQQQAKRKASAAGMDNHGTGRSVKRRASKACQCCRARKVRCNVTEHGAPCTNCRLDEVECIVSESRRKKSVPPARPATAKALVGRMSSLLSAIFFSFPLCAIEMEKTGARG